MRGKRAISIPATISSSFDGLLHPGDRVDVLFTAKANEASQETTVPLLQNLLVMALGEDLGDANPDPQRRGGAGRHGSVTLATSLDQGQMLAFAATKGQLTLLLRNADDTAIVDDLPETTLDQIMKPQQRAKIQASARPEKIGESR
jgi:pilus assembly protein CpaB